MSERPEDSPDTEPAAEQSAGGPPAPGEAGQRPADAPWWHEPHSGPSQWAGHTTPDRAEPSWPTAETAAASPQPGQRAEQDAPGGQGQHPGGGWQSHPGYQQGPYAQGPYGQGDPSRGAWSGGPWAGGGWEWTPPGGTWGHQMGASPPGRSPRRRRALAAIGASALTVLALGVGVGIGYGVWNGGAAPAASRVPVLPGGRTASVTTPSTSGTSKVSSATGAPSDIASIAKKVTPDLVDINTVLGYETEEAAGTGMVLTSTGKILTNNHVIEGSTSIKVTDLGNDKTYTASVVGYDRTQDVAVIQLKNASGLKTATLGNSSSVKVGEAIVGIGNAGGTGGTPSAAGGSVTALDQSITASDEGSLGTTTEHLTGLIESNADIQPGDSGGPLVNTSGQVLGMDTAASAAQGYSFQGAATGQGYSIPINTAISVAHQIIAGKATPSVHIGGTGFLGVYVETATSRTRAGGGFGFTTATSTPGSTTATTGGAVVAAVIPSTPAQKAGLAEHDVITSVAGTTVTSSSDVTKLMMQYHPGQTVKVTWTTPTGQSESASVTLANGPAD